MVVHYIIFADEYLNFFLLKTRPYAGEMCTLYRKSLGDHFRSTRIVGDKEPIHISMLSREFDNDSLILPHWVGKRNWVDYNVNIRSGIILLIVQWMFLESDF